MNKIFILLLICILIPGCGKSKSTYQLVVGSKTIELIVHDDPKLIQDDLVTNLKPLWDELKTGNSVAFSIQRISPLDFGSNNLTTKSGDPVNLSGTQTRKSPNWRFFKNRNNRCGIDLLDAKGEISPDLWCKADDWEQIADILRINFDINWIENNIQNKDIEAIIQNKPAK
jgi:hypothetical protein